jgi:hypothetical protein
MDTGDAPSGSPLPVKLDCMTALPRCRLSITLDEVGDGAIYSGIARTARCTAA